jgi:hypothetical protein
MSPTPPHLRGLGMLRDRVGPRAFSASPRQDVFAGVLLRDITETELGDRPPWLEGHVGTFLGRPLHGRLALAGVPLSGGRCAGVNSPEGPSGSCAPKAPPAWHTRLRLPHPGGARAPRRGGAPARTCRSEPLQAGGWLIENRAARRGCGPEENPGFCRDRLAGKRSLWAARGKRESN